MSIKSKIVGDKKMRRVLKAIPEAVDANLRRVMEEESERALAKMKQLVPVNTGVLKKVLKKKVSKRGRLEMRVGIITKRDKKRAWYAHFVEFGTKGYQPGELIKSRKTIAKRVIFAHRAQPFLNPAWREIRPQFVARWEKGTRTVIRAARRKGVADV